MTARDDGRAAAQAMLRTDPLSTDSINLIADKVMDAYAPGHRGEVLAESVGMITLPEREFDQLIAVATLYLAAFADDERMSFTETWAYQDVRDIVTKSRRPAREAPEPAVEPTTGRHPKGRAPTCAHCGEPFGDVAVLTTPGGANRDDCVWHAGRPLCLAAAQAHRALINELGYIVPPTPEPNPNRPDACSEPPCRDTEICANHELAADYAEGDHRFCGPGCDGGEAP